MIRMSQAVRYSIEQKFGLEYGSRIADKLGGSGDISIDLPSGANVWLRGGTSDIPTFFQIMVREEYNIERSAHFRRLVARYEDMLSSQQVPLIVDLGANIGLSALWFGAKFPRARILAVEPAVDNLAVLRRNIEGLPNIEAIHGAIWDVECNLVLTHTTGEPWGYRVAENVIGDVSGYTVDKLSGGQPILVAKIDIEGAESALFRSNTSWLSRTDLLVIELHDWKLPGQGSSRTFFRAIAERKFEFLQKGEHSFFFFY
jgi:FkbM family methyltransferase